MMRFTKRLVITTVASLVLSGTALAEKNDPLHTGEGFTAGEHVTLGDSVKVYLSDGTASDGVLHLNNGLALTYGDIVSLGDFYGTPNQSIALGKTKADRENLFLTAFNQFSSSSTVTNEVQQILEITHGEKKLVDAAAAAGQSVEAVYKQISEDNNRRYNCVTGGGCSGEWWLSKGRYLELAQTDYDHFTNYALIAYQTGHELAIAQAIKAHNQQDVKLLEKAYAMNAFAGHFLSDRFSAGHVRTPRLTLDLNVTPILIGALLSHYMHDEESKYGLHVHNARDDHWVAYGDKHFLDNVNAMHRQLMHEAMQKSADEIFAAYKTGVQPPTEVLDIIPEVDVANDTVGLDIAPMFYWDDAQKKMYRRSQLADPYDYHFTTNWWGWSTFIELSRLYGMPQQGIKRNN